MKMKKAKKSKAGGQFDAAEFSTLTITGTTPCDHSQNWIMNEINRWWGRQAVKVCTNCGAILDWKTGKQV